jgi:hypothetical protein
MQCHIATLVMTLLLAQSEVDEAQFDRIVRGSYSQIKDIVFVFEGSSRWAGVEHQDERLQEGEQVFQGTYAWREDGAKLLDTYRHYLFRGHLTFHHDTAAQIKDKLTAISREPDRREADTFPVESRANPRSMNDSLSPQSIFYQCYFTAPRSPLSKYEFEGWDEVDGHKCMKVRFLHVSEDDMSNAWGFTRFWIDIERGAHPLKEEAWSHGNLLLRTHGIQLARVSSKDRSSYWLPVRGIRDGYASGVDKNKHIIYTSTPYSQVTISIVEGSIRINEGIPDKQFSIYWRGGFPETDALKRQRTDFASIPLPPPVSKDPLKVRERLENRLREAERQSRALDASSPARETWKWPFLLQIVLITLGVTSLAGIAIRNWRRR